MPILGIEVGRVGLAILRNRRIFIGINVLRMIANRFGRAFRGWAGGGLGRFLADGPWLRSERMRLTRNGGGRNRSGRDSEPRFEMIDRASQLSQRLHFA